MSLIRSRQAQKKKQDLSHTVLCPLENRETKNSVYGGQSILSDIMEDLKKKNTKMRKTK